MKTIAAVVLGVLFFSLATVAGDKKIEFTFLDTLNKGKELSISDADFASSASLLPLKTVEPDTKPLPDTLAAAAKTLPKKEPGIVASRFRIQVLASTSQEQVKREKASLTSKIDVPVSISFESPYYKLFAGEFTQRSEAENYLAQVKNLGYNDAWISRIVASPK